jgi:hypothetical protein
MAGFSARIFADQFLPQGTIGLAIGISVLMGMYTLVIFLTGCLQLDDIKRLVNVKGPVNKFG